MALPVGVPAIGRFSVRKIAEFFKKCKTAVAGSTMTLVMAGDGKDKGLRTTAKVVIDCGADSATLDVADSGGSIRNFANLDDAVKAVSKESGVQALGLEVTVGDIWDAAIPSDLIASAKRRRTVLQAALDKSKERGTKLGAEIGLMVGWENGTAVQAARKSNAVAAKASVDADVASYAAEIADITASVGA